MNEQIKRKTGIQAIGDKPFGTHLCQFYNTKEELIHFLAPYFQAGLENNEFCLWIVSDPLKKEEAKKALTLEIKDFDTYFEKKQFEILDFYENFQKSGQFEYQTILEKVMEKANHARLNNFEGLRMAGAPAWQKHEDWKNLTSFEATVTDALAKLPIMAICSYSLKQCGMSEVINVVSNHHAALIHQKNQWVSF